MHPPLLVLVVLSVITSGASAAVNVIGNYRLGEDDPGAVNWGSVGAFTVDSAGSNNLPHVGGAATYTSDTGVSGSTFSVGFGGGGFSLATPIISQTSNWGVEAWVRGNPNQAGASVVVYNGNSSNSGMGLYRVGGDFVGLIGGITFVGSVPVTTSWTHLALVADGGTTAFYVNGIVTALGPLPNPPAGSFNVGIRGDLAEWLDGQIDEVRAFTFAPGEFNAQRDLQLNAVVPEPASAALIGAAAVGFALRRRRAR